MKIIMVGAACVMLLAAASGGEVYKVGPGEEVQKISAIADRLEPGDVVELTGDIEDSMVLEKSGTAQAPIVVRSPEGKRYKIDFAGEKNGIETRGDWWTFERLELCNASFRGLFQISHGIVVRDCYFHDNHDGIMGADDTNTGDITVEYCEFYHNGNGIYGHQIYLASWKPGATAVVQFNYFHESSGGCNIKTRMPRNIIRYNWVEGASNYECDLVDSDKGPANLRPMYLAFIGNVVVTNNIGNPHHQMNVASDQPRSPGTKNSYVFVNNLFVINRETHESHMIRVGGDPDYAGFYNNAFVGPNVKEFRVMCFENVEADEGEPGTKGFVKELVGVNNFVAANGVKIPKQFAGTVKAEEAGLADFAGNDFTLVEGSACVGAGAADAPLAARYMPPMRKKMAPGEETLRPVGEGIDIGPFGATVEGAKDTPKW